MVHIFIPSTQEAGSGGQGQHGLQSKFQVSQSYTEKTCLKNPRVSQEPQCRETKGWSLVEARGTCFPAEISHSSETMMGQICRTISWPGLLFEHFVLCLNMNLMQGLPKWTWGHWPPLFVPPPNVTTLNRSPFNALSNDLSLLLVYCRWVAGPALLDGVLALEIRGRKSKHLWRGGPIVCALVFLFLWMPCSKEITRFLGWKLNLFLYHNKNVFKRVCVHTCTCTHVLIPLNFFVNLRQARVICEEEISV